jgi:hypothetical protein
MTLADEHDSLIFHTTIGSKQALIFQAIDAEPFASSAVVLLFVDDDAQIVRLKLDVIQLGV